MRRGKYTSDCSGEAFTLLPLLFLNNMLGYADRTNLSVAVIAMSRELGWGEASTGTLLASFFCGYVLTQIPAGLAAARFGAKRVLLARVVVGLAEGVQIPCCNALLAAWVPLHGRARALSFIFSGQFVGTICALSCSPLAEWWWPSIFLLWRRRAPPQGGG
uniref:Major facilitator superfamily (MFS) profile domain-containing protein n=2 Tax=Emiliania huxleyi TaxID=2903 RepID=A0A0D3I5Y1_EMIH1